MIGVLAVMSILLAMIIPAFIKKYNIAAATNEAQTLKTMAESLKLHIKRNWTIPSETNWADVIAAQMGWERGAVLTNERRLARAFVIDPLLRIGPTTNSVLPYVQTVQGSIKPISPRLMIISSLSEPLPISSGVMSSSNDFNIIWNTPEDTIPAIWNTWKGKGELLRIQRINLSPLFKRVRLEKSLSDGVPYYGIGTNYDVTGVSKAQMLVNLLTNYYIEGSILYLYNTNNVLNVRHLIETDVNFYFANNRWGLQPLISEIIRGEEFQAMSELFMSAPLNANAKNGATPTLVVNAISNYLYFYIQWANTGFDKKSPYYSLLNSAQNQLDTLTDGLIWKPRP